jgi:hypothetical protein
MGYTKEQRLAKEFNQNVETMTDTIVAEKPKTSPLWDKCLLSVKRTARTKNGRNYATTESIQVMKIERAAIPNEKALIDRLNAVVDHQNETENGMPMIVYFVPSGKVKQGDEYKAKDIKALDEDGEKTDKIIGIDIDFDTKL